MERITKTFLNKKYDELYAKGQEILDKYGVCKGPNGEPCFKGTFCCDDCPHLKSTGCSVKSLGCKLWLCFTAGENDPVASKAMQDLRSEGYKLDLMSVRTTKRRALELASNNIKNLPRTMGGF